MSIPRAFSSSRAFSPSKPRQGPPKWSQIPIENADLRDIIADYNPCENLQVDFIDLASTCLRGEPSTRCKADKRCRPECCSELCDEILGAIIQGVPKQFKFNYSPISESAASDEEDLKYIRSLVPPDPKDLNLLNSIKWTPIKLVFADFEESQKYYGQYDFKSNTFYGGPTGSNINSSAVATADICSAFAKGNNIVTTVYYSSNKKIPFKMEMQFGGADISVPIDSPFNVANFEVGPEYPQLKVDLYPK